MSEHKHDFCAALRGSLVQLDEIPEAESWPVSERLTAMFFILLDAIESLDSDSDVLNQSFREATGFSSAFNKALREELLEVMQAQDIPGVNRLVVDTAPVRFIVSELIIQLLKTSLHDTTVDRQRSAALADKVLAFASSLLASPVADKAVDVVRYAVEAGYLPLDRIPIISSWFGADEES